MEQIHTPFIKVTTPSQISLTSEQKVLLNRRGNQLFNDGKIGEAERIFILTGYSDGLTRVGDHYAHSGKTYEALTFYLRAKNKRKSQPIIDSLTNTIRILLDADKKGVKNVR